MQAKFRLLDKVEYWPIRDQHLSDFLIFEKELKAIQRNESALNFEKTHTLFQLFYGENESRFSIKNKFRSKMDISWIFTFAVVDQDPP